MKSSYLFFLLILSVVSIHWALAAGDDPEPVSATNGGEAPAAGGEAPATGEEAPAAGGEAPATGEEAPAAGGEASTTGEEAPAAGGEASTTGEEAPAAGGEAPATGEEAPAAGGEASTAGEEAPVAGGEASTTGEEAPAAGGEASTTGGEVPAAGGEAPVTGGEVPAAGGEAPATGEEAPAAGGEAPATGGEVPVAGGEAPATGEEAPAAGGEAPATGGEAPAAGGEAPATGGESQNTGTGAEPQQQSADFDYTWLSRDCYTVLNKCTPNKETTDICKLYKDAINCTNAGIQNENGTLMCTKLEHVWLDATICQLPSLMNSLLKAADGMNTCKDHLMKVFSTPFDVTTLTAEQSVEDHICDVFKSKEKALLTESNDMVCTESEYGELKADVCLACRGSLASAVLVLLMCVLQAILTRQ